MSLQRSKSAPQTVSALVGGNQLPRSSSLDQINTQLKAGAPRTEKEDPFSLSGFFPTLFGERNWNWLREEGEGAHGGWDASHGMEEEESGVIFGHAEWDKLTRDAIKDEDKLGILSLETLFDGVGGPLLSPYAHEEAVDEESLYLGLRSRREGVTVTNSTTGSSGLELFCRE